MFQDVAGRLWFIERHVNSVNDQGFPWDLSTSEGTSSTCDPRLHGRLEDFKDLWRRYDQDDNGVLDMEDSRNALWR